MIYMASPYSTPDRKVKWRRYRDVCYATAVLLKRGFVVFAPIVYNHLLATRYGMDGHWEFWKFFDLSMIAHAEEVWVYCLDGWEDSVGVLAEIAEAERLGLRVRFIDPSWLGI